LPVNCVATDRELRQLALAICGLLAAAVPGGRLPFGLSSTVITPATTAATAWRIEVRAAQIHSIYGAHRPPFN
jgi:hypothetical protein